MRNDATIDNRKVVARNASLLCGRGRIVKAGMAFTYQDSAGVHLARSLGRVSAPALGDCQRVDGFVLAMVLSSDATHAFERWINPDDILEVFESPAKLAAFFFGPIECSAQEMRDAMAYGTTCERYVDKFGERVAQFRAANKAA